MIAGAVTLGLRRAKTAPDEIDQRVQAAVA
jgi:hypothetical protein